MRGALHRFPQRRASKYLTLMDNETLRDIVTATKGIPESFCSAVIWDWRESKSSPNSTALTVMVPFRHTWTTNLEDL